MGKDKSLKKYFLAECSNMDFEVGIICNTTGFRGSIIQNTRLELYDIISIKILITTKTGLKKEYIPSSLNLHHTPYK
jgi:hypothetical protein